MVCRIFNEIHRKYEKSIAKTVSLMVKFTWSSHGFHFIHLKWTLCENKTLAKNGT